MRRKWTMMVCMCLLLTLILPHTAMAAQEKPEVLVCVVDEAGVPIVGVAVTLWNHSARPSENMGTVKTDETGNACFALPEMKGPTNQLSQHLSASVYAPGYVAKVSDWSISRREVAKQMDGIMTLAVQPASTSTSITLITNPDAIRSDKSDQLPVQSYIGETRERLIYWDYTSNQRLLSKVADLYQAGEMRTQFTYESIVKVKSGVAIKYGKETGFQITGEIGVESNPSTTMTWKIEPSTDKTSLKYRECQTYFDYRVEEYAIEEFKDRGDGMLDWIQVSSYTKAYCQGLSAYATPTGPATVSASAPSPSLPYTDIGHSTEGGWAKTTRQYIGVAASFWVSGIKVTIPFNHDQSTTEKWWFQNTSPTNTYQGAPQPDGVYRVRLKP